MLLDSYAIADTGVGVAIRQEEKRSGSELACHKGCDACCRQKDIPLYPHELVGIYWYTVEEMGQSQRNAVKEQIQDHADGSPCPFLVERSCSLHPVRPVSCRQFNVFNAPCAPGEDPYYTRRGDVLQPIQNYADRTFAAVLPFYGVRQGADRAKAVQVVRSQALNLQTYDWEKLLAKLEEFDSKNRSVRREE